MYLYINFEDTIMRDAKMKRITRNTKAVTNIVLYSGVGILVGTGIIGMGIVGDCALVMCASKIVKIGIKKSGIVNKILCGKVKAIEV